MFSAEKYFRRLAHTENSDGGQWPVTTKNDRQLSAPPVRQPANTSNLFPPDMELHCAFIYDI
jgi:hypothetical protein